MALRKPLVMVDGQLQQIQSGDLIDSTLLEASAVELTATTNLVIGNVVYADGNDSCDLAQADAAATVEAIGFCSEVSVDSAVLADIYTDGGVLTATTGQWDAVAGTTGGLTAGDMYYVDPDAAGNITDTAPTTTGDYVKSVGRAISTTDLKIDLRASYLM